jgi:tRNA modification GTPase
MVGYDAAIVTDIEGTTRDILREEISLGKMLIRLADTAGLRESTDTVESIGIERAIEELSGAKIIFAVFDGTKPLGDEDMRLIDEIDRRGENALRLAVINKSDLGANMCDEDESLLRNKFSSVHHISAKNGAGFDKLVESAERAFIDGDINIEEDAIIMNERQMSAVEQAYDGIMRACDGLSYGLEIDMCCDDVELAMRALGELDGRNVSEDIVGAIFTRFCVGK